MKIIPERVTVLSDTDKCELTIIMDGFRITLTGEEARALSYALSQGAKQLYQDQAAPRAAVTKPVAVPAPHDIDSAGSAEFRSLGDTVKQLSERQDSAGVDAKRSLTV